MKMEFGIEIRLIFRMFGLIAIKVRVVGECRLQMWVQSIHLRIFRCWSTGQFTSVEEIQVFSNQT